MGYGKVGVSKERMCSYKHTHNSAVHTPDGVVKSELSTYQFGKNNPIFYIDKDGNDEYAFNVNTGELSWVSGLGGNNTQYVSFIQLVDEGSAARLLNTASVNGKNVYITDIGGAQPKFVISNYDLKLAPNYNENSYKNYEYDATDLRKRRSLMAGGSVLWTAVQNLESAGNAQPIDLQNYYDHYGEVSGRLMAFGQFSSIMLELTELGGQLDDLVDAGAAAREIRKLNKQITKTRKAASKAFRQFNKENAAVSSKSVPKGKDGRSLNPWNKWLSQNKGKYKGKDAIKQAAKDYKKQ